VGRGSGQCGVESQSAVLLRKGNGTGEEVKVSFDKWYPVIQPQVGLQAEVFAKRVERLNAERAVQVQVDQQVKKFHQ